MLRQAAANNDVKSAESKSTEPTVAEVKEIPSFYSFPVRHAEQKVIAREGKIKDKLFVKIVPGFKYVVEQVENGLNFVDLESKKIVTFEDGKMKDEKNNDEKGLLASFKRFFSKETKLDDPERRKKLQKQIYGFTALSENELILLAVKNITIKKTSLTLYKMDFSKQKQEIITSVYDLQIDVQSLCEYMYVGSYQFQLSSSPCQKYLIISMAQESVPVKNNTEYTLAWIILDLETKFYKIEFRHNDIETYSPTPKTKVQALSNQQFSECRNGAVEIWQFDLKTEFPFPFGKRTQLNKILFKHYQVKDFAVSKDESRWVTCSAGDAIIWEMDKDRNPLPLRRFTGLGSIDQFAPTVFFADNYFYRVTQNYLSCAILKIDSITTDCEASVLADKLLDPSAHYFHKGIFYMAGNYETVTSHDFLMSSEMEDKINEDRKKSEEQGRNIVVVSEDLSEPSKAFLTEFEKVYSAITNQTDANSMTILKEYAGQLQNLTIFTKNLTQAKREEDNAICKNENQHPIPR